ncbi:PspC domain-containing protein [Bifidobacterium pullorum subsp. saeculare]|uniref:PspC domain-containing protein n=1 Tax=Bifidobacterium pullorum subsp. saeculare TaxID=78257 RepID=A0A938WXM4_9BIFI|nr:ATP-binding protein [Bifidobacterium pullorum]MBM6699781.1 PspC domain-containing protein [Bifidobacterium pullorum subsp. saeculare]
MSFFARRRPSAPPRGPQPSADPRPEDGTAPAPLAPARLPLIRPRQGRWLTGVCKGVALHLGVKVGWVRLAFLLAACLWGTGIVAYVFLWLFMPVGDPLAAAGARRRAADASRAPLSHGNAPDAAEREMDQAAGSSEGLVGALRHAPKPALVALAGLLLVAVALLLMRSSHGELVLPLALACAGLVVAWARFDADEGQLPTMVGGIALLFLAYAIYVVGALHQDIYPRGSRFVVAGLLLLTGTGLAIVPWTNATMRTLGRERALKEREEERADMTAHLHDGVLQTLALIQVHNAEPETVFTLARSQERELRAWLYQTRVGSDRSVGAGLKAIAAEVEDAHGKPIEVVTVGDARPCAATDALLDATRQALVNAVTHGGEPVSVYCEAGADQVEVFVRDHGAGFDVDAVPPDRLGIRESIIGRIRRRGGTVEIVSRPGWGTEVRMHMPVQAEAGARSAPRAGSDDGRHATA